MPTPRTLIVFNPVAGGGRARAAAEALAAAFRAEPGILRGAELLPSRAADPREWLLPQLGSRRLLVVCGGDGAVRQALPALVEHPGVRLWHAPCGTENLVARMAGMRRDAASLRAAVAADREALVDLMEVRPLEEEREPPPSASAGAALAFMMVGAGFDAEVVARLAAVRAGAISHMSYARPLLETLLRWRAPRVSLRWDGGGAEGRGSVVVANAPAYALGMVPIPAARADDGRLDAAIVPARAGPGAILRGALTRLGCVPKAVAAEWFEVRLEPPGHWQLDGDPSPWGIRGGLRVRCRAGAVPVLLPAPPGAGQSVAARRPWLDRPGADSTVTTSDRGGE